MIVLRVLSLPFRGLTWLLIWPLGFLYGEALQAFYHGRMFE